MDILCIIVKDVRHAEVDKSVYKWCELCEYCTVYYCTQVLLLKITVFIISIMSIHKFIDLILHFFIIPYTCMSTVKDAQFQQARAKNTA